MRLRICNRKDYSGDSIVLTPNQIASLEAAVVFLMALLEGHADAASGFTISNGNEMNRDTVVTCRGSIVEIEIDGGPDYSVADYDSLNHHPNYVRVSF